jgi:hypothetical protein
MQGLLKTSRKVSFDPKVLDSCQETWRKEVKVVIFALAPTYFFPLQN